MKQCQLLLLTMLSVCCIIQLSQGKAKLDRYCTTPYCYRNNIACDKKVDLSKSCQKNAKLLPMTKYKSFITDTLNNLRNNVAGGKEYRLLPAAARMAKMIWSTELELFAKLDVSRCNLLPRFCMSSPAFYYIGSLAEQYDYAGAIQDVPPFEIIKDMLISWSKEVVSVGRRHTLKLPGTLDNHDIYRTTLLMSERNTHVGCAAVRFTYEKFHHVQFSCAFATENFIDRGLYKWGVYPGSKCRRRDKYYKNLCAAGETYDNEKKYRSATIYQRPYY